MTVVCLVDLTEGTVVVVSLPSNCMLDIADGMPVGRYVVDRSSTLVDVAEDGVCSVWGTLGLFVGSVAGDNVRGVAVEAIAGVAVAGNETDDVVVFAIVCNTGLRVGNGVGIKIGSGSGVI